MKGRSWMNSFIKALVETEEKSNIERDSEWTDYMKTVMESVAKGFDCYLAMTRKRPEDDEYSGEYLNIDVLFLSLDSYTDWDSDTWDPPALPLVAVDLENNLDVGKITYCLWKILCIRAPLRILICYQATARDVSLLRRELEDVIKQWNLMRDSPDELLVVIGDESKSNDEPWVEYLKVCEWRDSKLREMQRLSW